MVLIMVSVRDRAADTFARPFCVPSIGVAMRTFADEINRASGDNPLYQHPEDYDLYEIGGFDEATGDITNNVVRMVSVGKDVSTKKE